MIIKINANVTIIISHLIHQGGFSIGWSFGILQPGVHDQLGEIVGVRL